MILPPEATALTLDILLFLDRSLQEELEEAKREPREKKLGFQLTEEEGYSRSWSYKGKERKNKEIKKETKRRGFFLKFSITSSVCSLNPIYTDS